MNIWTWEISKSILLNKLQLPISLIHHMEWQSVLKKKMWWPVTEWFSERLENISACSEMLITSSFHVSCQCKWNEWNCSVISCSLFLSFHTGSAVGRFHAAAVNWGSSPPLVAAICSSHDVVDESEEQETVTELPYSGSPKYSASQMLL